MDPVFWLLHKADPFLIAPYRWLPDPVLGWWLGSAVLAFWCVLLGLATMSLARWVNREYIEREKRRMLEGQSQSWEALQAGNKLAYKGFNEQANDSFGKSFFMGAAMGAASLWPAFVALAWLTWRFGRVSIPLPPTPWEVGPVAAFIPLYIALRLLWSLTLRLCRAPAEPASTGRKS